MSAPLLIGLTGRREVGKSFLAHHLFGQGWQTVHTFAAGKAAAAAYFEYLGIPKREIWEMVHGQRKDTRDPRLPEGQSPRYFMERLGYFMGVTLGSEWTLGPALDYLSRRSSNNPPNVVLESVVYEAPALKRRGGVIIRVVRPGHSSPEVEHTDAAQEAVPHDHLLVNDGTREQLTTRLDELLVDLQRRVP